MAVVQGDIKNALLSLYNSAKNSAMSETDFADGMATIIKNAILSQTITVSSLAVLDGESRTCTLQSGSCTTL